METCKHKKIKIKFVGFWPDFNQKDNFITKKLEKFYDVVISDNPDYLFYSVFNDEYVMYDCIRIFFTGENIAPNFQMCDYAIGFERLDFGDRYIRFPFYFGMNEYKDSLQQAIHKHECVKDKIESKTDFCSFVYSNSDTDGMRDKLFELLSKYKPVNAGGKLHNTYSGVCVTDKMEFESKHKFSIACENSSHSGYATEKILQAFSAGTVPIYFGDPTITQEFNPKAFINCHDYEKQDDLMAKIIDVDGDLKLYEEMLSEPIFLESDYAENTSLKLDEFLYNIFNQDLEKAYRRNRFFWGAKYEAKYKRVYKVTKLFHFLGEIVRRHK